jgi:hypothetical protein
MPLVRPQSRSNIAEIRKAEFGLIYPAGTTQYEVPQEIPMNYK